MVYSRFNLRPSLNLKYSLLNRSAYIGISGTPSYYYKQSLPHMVFFMVFGYCLPYVSVNTYRWLDKLPVWSQRLDRKREEKLAFDFMIKSLAEKERDIIEEFSDY